MFYTIRNMTLKILTVLCPTSGLGVLVDAFAGLDTKLAGIDVGVSRVATSTTFDLLVTDPPRRTRARLISQPV